ncbi:MAG: MarR family transcriptional regulator [Ferrovibrio sp.]|uniref:MarR family transcriptional regulator n=1 Tax=Ferrovibrio sp. TaxID=1917215 RepID=UPI0026060B1C|nr:MarR family transcriptional regulator [Ferrovibrio sp.]MCW0234958.1 MarR family transcriptional regulator [Ferrovibrio sp.]
MNENGASDGKPDSATLAALLHVIGNADEQHTQRSLAVRLDIALGLANALLRRCVSKGLIKIQNAPARRYAYYLTPSGFAEKSRLVAEYLETSLNFFRRARIQYEDIFSALVSRGVTKVAIAGSGELAEIALLSASAAGMTICAVIAPGRNEGLFHNRAVVSDLADALKLGAEAIIIADNTAPQATYDRLAADLSADRLHAPSLLHISADAPRRKERAA